MTPESVKYASSGAPLVTWKWGPLYSGSDIENVLRRRFTYGSWRPSDRAVLVVDGIVDETPLAAD
jgi:hypothetical protein